MRVSVIGCGNISNVHLEILASMEGIEISSVVDIVAEKADKAAEKYGCKAYYDYRKMLDEEHPDVVHICTPHYLHVEMSVEALSRDIHVLCEKPCAMNREELAKIKMAQLMSTCEYGVCFQNRYNASVMAVKKAVETGKYGAIKGARAIVQWCRNEDYYSDDWHGTLKKEGGGVVINQGIHTQDLLRYLMGCDVVSVTGHVSNDHLKDVIEVEDTAHARFIFENGTVGLYDATTAFGLNAKNIIDIFCERADLRVEGDRAYAIRPDGEIELLNTENDAEIRGKDYWGSGHEALIHDFYDCIATGRRFPIDSHEGGKSVEEFSAIYESSKLGEEVIIKRK